MSDVWKAPFAILSVLLFATGALIAQSTTSLQTSVAGSDMAAATSVSNAVYRVTPASTPAGKKLSKSQLTNKKLASVPTLPRPGFYPADLVNHGGAVVTSAEQNPVYFDCPAGPTACWGNPTAFLTRLNNSALIHLTDQYVGTTANFRYPVGPSVKINQTLQTNVLGLNDILSILHAAATKLSVPSGYNNIVHLFLPQGVDTCFDLTTVCYSPDNPPSFAFCAYHGSVVFNDIGHILFTVEPYQNVPGCQVASPSPNGSLVDSTASVLSHETFETITDPDLDAWWSDVSLIEQGAEIGDICEPVGNGAGQFLDPTFIVGGKNYKIQLEYSNKFHGCTH
ncbi:MAG TPA: hypothetical protein VGL74_04940 [Terriglobales bacterium]